MTANHPAGAADNPGVVALPPLIFAAPLAAGLLLDLVFPASLLPGRPGTAVGAVLAAAGLALGGWGQHTMRRAGTNPDPRRPATVLVTDGPFRLTRNPLYLSLTLLYAGVAFLADSPWSLLFLPAALVVVHFGVVLREERYLERKFGDSYRRYRATVRRWI